MNDFDDSKHIVVVDLRVRSGPNRHIIEMLAHQGRPLVLTLHHALVLKLLFAAPTQHSEPPCRIIAIKPWCFEILTETFGI